MHSIIFLGGVFLGSVVATMGLSLFMINRNETDEDEIIISCKTCAYFPFDCNKRPCSKCLLTGAYSAYKEK